jgi:predicted DNA-binding protein
VSTPPQPPVRPSVSVRLPLSSAERLDDLARAMGRRRSDVLRRAVEELLERLANQNRSL